MKRVENKLRVISSITLCIAYITTLYFNTTVGAQLYLIGNSLALPYMIKHKCWDLVALLLFFIIVGLPKTLGY